MRPWTGSASSNTWETRASVSSVANGFVSNVICMVALSPPVAIHSLFGFPARFLGALVLPAVPSFFALRQRDFALGDAVAKVYAQRNYGQTLGFGAASELVNF